VCPTGRTCYRRSFLPVRYLVRIRCASRTLTGSVSQGTAHSPRPSLARPTPASSCPAEPPPAELSTADSPSIVYTDGGNGPPIAQVAVRGVTAAGSACSCGSAGCWVGCLARAAAARHARCVSAQCTSGPHVRAQTAAAGWDWIMAPPYLRAPVRRPRMAASSASTPREVGREPLPAEPALPARWPELGRCPELGRRAQPTGADITGNRTALPSTGAALAGRTKTPHPSGHSK
jgi:hypothetical protein